MTRNVKHHIRTSDGWHVMSNAISAHRIRSCRISMFFEHVSKRNIRNVSLMIADGLLLFFVRWLLRRIERDYTVGSSIFTRYIRFIGQVSGFTFARLPKLIEWPTGKRWPHSGITYSLRTPHHRKWTTRQHTCGQVVPHMPSYADLCRLECNQIPMIFLIPDQSICIRFHVSRFPAKNIPNMWRYDISPFLPNWPFFSQNHQISPSHEKKHFHHVSPKNWEKKSLRLNAIN